MIVPPARTLAIAAAITLSLVLAGCGGGRSSRVTGPAYPSGAACVRLLAERGIAVQPWQGGSRACPIDTPVRAARGAMAGFSPPLETSCSMLYAWSGFEAQLDRTARTILGSPVVAVRHYGSYGCRSMTDGSGRPSLHAQARALDIAGFVLADGRTVTVVAGWYGRPDERRFLRAVAAAACRTFSVVLTPNSDRYHRDHIHVDIGPWRKCGL